jgi:AcrR family transcriptional regulator
MPAPISHASSWSASSAAACSLLASTARKSSPHQVTARCRERKPRRTIGVEVPFQVSGMSKHTDTGARPMRADAVRNRARILAAAEHVFALEGAGVPIDDVAREAGLGIGTLYRHFPTKEDLLQAVVVSRIASLVDQAHSLAGDNDPGTAFFDFLRSYTASAGMNKALHDSLADAGIDVRAATASLKQELNDALEVLLKRAQVAGAVRDDIGIEELKVAVSGTCLGIGYANADASTRDRTVEILFDGLRAHAQR